jgi:hypothetical protein
VLESDAGNRFVSTCCIFWLSTRKQVCQYLLHFLIEYS